ncbi:hypothetical protein SAMN04488120_10199 [Fontimonas thermophila]|uniref:Uncharacterized protein n=1 Tax=Fontimonas thermophila TaxID=1076937 RepID=A0A1I2H246_9GAMM|nr:hypothetical protein [Fontimonas thermophila]SFF23772.1 hypothetical protein SAMN04488120_10199 [Fontimonas thermophila]
MAEKRADWLEPPLWWKKWRPLRWLAGAAVVALVYAWLSEDSEKPTAAPAEVAAPSAPAPHVAPPQEAAISTVARESAPTPAVTTAAAAVPAAPSEPTHPAEEAFIYEEDEAPPAADSELAAFTRVEPDPVRLLGSYKSYMGVDEVVYGLEQAGFKPIVESHHTAVPAGVPPRALDVVTVHQFRHWGVQGQLELQFFNDRLYQTEFEPEDPERYLAAQRRELPQLARQRSGRAELIDGHLRIASSLDLAVSEIGRKLRTRPFILWQDRRLIRQRDEWDRRFAAAIAR